MQSNHDSNIIFKEIENLAGNSARILCISGISDIETAPVVSRIAGNGGQNILVVPERKNLTEIADAIKCFTDIRVEIMPDEDELIIYDAKDMKSSVQRMEIIKNLTEGEDMILVATGASLMTQLPDKEVVKNSVVYIDASEEYNLNRLVSSFIYAGYERVGICEAKGQFSLRGGILDIFPIGYDNPIRIEFFDEEVDSIRSYDKDTQRSIEQLEKISVFPRLIMNLDEKSVDEASNRLEKEYLKSIKKAEKTDEKIASNLRTRLAYLKEHIKNRTNLTVIERYSSYFSDSKSTIFEYLSDDSVIFFDDIDKVASACEEFEKSRNLEIEALIDEGLLIKSDTSGMISYADIKSKISEQKNITNFQTLPKAVKTLTHIDMLKHIRAGKIGDYGRNTELLIQDLKSYHKRGFDINFICSSEEKKNSTANYLLEHGIDFPVKYSIGNLSYGIEYFDEKIILLTEKNIFGYRKKKSLVGKRKNNSIRNFSDIQAGDFVVHEIHGIGKFIGIETIEVLGVSKDYLKVKYAGADSLYIPVDQMNLIQKYIGTDGRIPKISKLSGTEWQKTKQKAKMAVMDMAKDILEISAARMAREGHGFQEDTVWQREFEDMFPYEETDDQIRAIAEIKGDMEKPIPMDRLLCGDVGYGKTEVAARALFKCLADGMQAAVLVPTTLLANQHYYTLKDRFEHFPFKVEMLSRFRNEAEQKEIIKDLKSGKIDMVIGTHRMLSDDVDFKNLGLLVIDEEQRFGVKHKEKIKSIKNRVDVLTLSATPIPRTLNMSLVGIKSMSVIAEPPEERYPVETYIMEMRPYVVKTAIEKELARGGQVFVVFNRVKGIQKLAGDISKLIPDAKIAVGHGQMEEKQLEDVMMSFVSGEKDILISTTIIETGIDISNANTIIIVDADKYGLSQLYQLRGRVGRSTRKAYAYLLYTPDKVLTELAEKRLKAIRDFTEFGAGFKVAMRDLEIRGAGNLLGTNQSGHMVDVGYEMYCKLLAEAVAEMKGESTPAELRDVDFEINVSAFIPSSYIEDEEMRLDIYKRIADIDSKDDAADITDELLDRFGDIPKQTINLINISYAKKMAIKNEIQTIKTVGDKIVFEFYEGAMLSREAVAKISDVYRMKSVIYGTSKPSIKITKFKKDIPAEIIDFLSLFG